LAGALIVAAPVILFKIKDSCSVEEDLKFSDETMENVIGHPLPEKQVDE